MKNSLAGAGATPTRRAPVGRFGDVIASALIGASSLVATPALAQDTTMKLIEMMHANGSITDAQFDQLKAAAAEESRKSSTQMMGATAGANTSASITPGNGNNTAGFRQSTENRFDKLAWLDRIKFKGDLRLRYEYNDNNGRKNAAGHQIKRNRGRLRYRLGVITNPIDNLEIGGGIASGGGDPRSTNQTLGNDFSSKPIRLDYAYAEYKFNNHVEAVGGKFKFGDYLWAPTDLIWDGDINPEGASVHLRNDTSFGTTFVNSGVWVLQEFSGNSSDPYLFYLQGGQHFEINNFFASLAGTYYGYENTAQPGTFNPSFSAGTNTGNQFSVVDVNGQIGTRFGDHGKASLIGEYVKNVHSGVNDDTGYALGTKVGWDRWAMKHLYGDLDANAVPDTFPDSDRLGGATAVKGHEIALSYQLNDAVKFGLDYYNTQSKRMSENEQLLQFDVGFKF